MCRGSEYGSVETQTSKRMLTRIYIRDTCKVLKITSFSSESHSGASSRFSLEVRAKIISLFQEVAVVIRCKIRPKESLKITCSKK